MKRLITLIAAGLILAGCQNKPETKKDKISENQTQKTVQKKQKEDSVKIQIKPISHATAVITWEDKVFYTDPVGGAEAFKAIAKPDFVLITDIHGDHMDAATLNALELGETKLIVPLAVKEKLPEELQSNLIVINNGESINHMGFKITAIPMYNLPQSKDAMHVKGRGNGYVLEYNGERLYISGDTEDIPDMRNLKNIDVALVPMNLPYTMPVKQAAEGVLAFKPKKVIPYHYRGKDGFADIEKFKEIVSKANKNIRVELMDWYPKNK
jgi:L-ascorbate metabolism protein UlaG (beta-lactamase superfamily)